VPDGECCVEKTSSQKVVKECRMKKKSTNLGVGALMGIKERLFQLRSAHPQGGAVEVGVWSTQ